MSVIEDGSVETGLEGRGARCLALDPEDPDTLYVGTSDEGIFKSEDGGGYVGEALRDRTPQGHRRRRLAHRRGRATRGRSLRPCS